MFLDGGDVADGLGAVRLFRCCAEWRTGFGRGGGRGARRRTLKVGGHTISDRQLRYNDVFVDAKCFFYHGKEIV